MAVSYHAQKVYAFDEDEPEFEAAWRLSELRARGTRVGRDCRAPRYLDYKVIGRLGQQVKGLKELVPDRQLHTIVFDDLQADPAAL